jgi:hypothetical protein
MLSSEEEEPDWLAGPPITTATTTANNRNGQRNKIAKSGSDAFHKGLLELLDGFDGQVYHSPRVSSGSDEEGGSGSDDSSEQKAGTKKSRRAPGSRLYGRIVGRKRHPLPPGLEEESSADHHCPYVVPIIDQQQPVLAQQKASARPRVKRKGPKRRAKKKFNKTVNPGRASDFLSTLSAVLERPSEEEQTQGSIGGSQTVGSATKQQKTAGRAQEQEALFTATDSVADGVPQPSSSLSSFSSASLEEKGCEDDSKTESIGDDLPEINATFRK